MGPRCAIGSPTVPYAAIWACSIVNCSQSKAVDWAPTKAIKYSTELNCSVRMFVEVMVTQSPKGQKQYDPERVSEMAEQCLVCWATRPGGLR